MSPLKDNIWLVCLGVCDVMSYRYRQGDWRRSDLGVHVHWHGHKDGHRYGYRYVLPLHTVIHICRHRHNLNVISESQRILKCHEVMKGNKKSVKLDPGESATQNIYKNVFR